VFELLKTALLCVTTMAVVLPLAFLAALSLPHNSEFRQMVMKACYWGVVLVAVGLIAMPVDLIPEIFFPIGIIDDAVYLAAGFLAARQAMKPRNTNPSRN
jgi:uncharacterized membrane protein YkvA (DUF1232 family)